MQVFKIVNADEWKAAQDAGIYRGSADDKRDGFIHLSTSGQLAGTLTRHFANADNLMLIALESDLLGDKLKWEPSHGEDYPHLYTALDLSLVRWTSMIPKKGPGVFALPVQAFAAAPPQKGRAS